MKKFTKKYFKKYKEQKWRWKFWEDFLKKKLEKGAKILEIGCAYGYLLKLLEKRYKTYGVDISPYAIEKAKKICKKTKFFVGNIEKIKLKNNFSAILCFDVLEHLKHPEKCIKKCYRALKKDGFLIISVPNTKSIFKPIKKEKWFGYRDKTHISLYPPEKWKKLIEGAHLTIVLQFTDGFFDIPYFPCIPKFFQKIFLIPGYLQYKLKKPFIKKIGENLIIVAKK